MEPAASAATAPPAARTRIADIASQFGVIALYTFGSRAREALAHVAHGSPFSPHGSSDLDIAVLPVPGRLRTADDRVRLVLALEAVFPAPRVDLVVLNEAPPFLALAAVSGELLFAADPTAEACYQLFVLRQAGDLAPFERERRARLLEVRG